ncbi:hypothetical protein OEZ85_008764 [Tetradesmus obliquus]|uniref:Zinc finger HIT domain-containing protein n=1 Tax=Tetradesmus obliquus TaxID=3088 RepID=A0ABY8TK53_TETOB|nr:hypothetical protein OEZ85_008764 [Tetradesmus obliquus]
MQRKVDFDIQLKDKLPAASVKVGLAVQIGQDQDSGTWSCTAADNVLGELPANVIASLRPQTPFTAVVRSVKRAADDPEAVSSVQIRLSYQTAEQPQQLVQAEPPADDPAGFTLTTTELERLAYNEEFRTTLGDKRLQELLLKIDSAPNREQALKQALESADFREFADRMLSVMKPKEYPRVP